MKKIWIMCIVIVGAMITQGCQATKGIDEAYLTAFEVLLQDSDLSGPFGFISLFINDTPLLDQDVVAVATAIHQTYGKEVFTYTPDEIAREGPYGKEDVSMDGIFLYLLEIKHEDGAMIIQAAAFHTANDRGSFGMEITLAKLEDEWLVQDTHLLWEE